MKDEKNVNTAEENGTELTDEEMAKVSGGDVTSANVAG